MNQPMLKWFNADKDEDGKNKGKFQGVRYLKHQTRLYRGQPDRSYYIRFKAGKKIIQECVGWASEGMNATQAKKIRDKLRSAYLNGEDVISLKQKRQLAEEKRQAKAEEEKRLRKERLTFGEFMELDYFPAAKASKKHWRDDMNRYKVHLADPLGDKPLKEITTFPVLEGLKKSLQEKGLAPATVKHCLVIVRQAFNRAISKGLFNGPNPVNKGLKLPKLNNAKMRVLTLEEENLLMSGLKARSQQTYEMSMVSLYSGLRFAEVAAMKWQDIDFEHNIIHVKGKGDRPRKVPLHCRLKEILETRRSTDVLPSDWIFPDRNGKVQARISALFYRVVDQLGLNAGQERKYRIDFHSLRHTFGTRLAHRAPITVVRDVLGHASLAMTSRYSHEAPNLAMTAVQSLGQEEQERENTGNGAAVIPLNSK